MADEKPSSEIFGEFMSGYSAIVLLLKRAAEHGFLVEYICLAATVIDATLRVALVLKHQLDTSTSEIPGWLIRQSENDKPLSERQVYRQAHATAIIDRALYLELQSLFTKRNRVVHRYIISQITTAEVYAIATEFEAAIQRVSDATRLLEDEQVRRGVGMTKEGPAVPEGELLRRLTDLSKSKHGADWIAKRLAESP